MRHIRLDYFVLSETKLDESFPSNQFNIENYEIRRRKDRDNYGVGLIEYIRKGVLSKNLSEFEMNGTEMICSEITISKKKWFIMSIYRSPVSSNLDHFFDNLISSLNKASKTYENFLLMGDFNIDL